MDRVVRFLGRIFLRYGKGGVPIVVLAAYSLAVPNEEILGSEHLEHLLDIAALVVVLLGLTVRAVAISSPVGNGSGLVESGLYALCRNPRYLGGLFVCVGIFLMHGSPQVVLVGTAACTLIYAAMVRIEEDDLRARYGNSYRAYCAAVPRWLPNLARAGRAASGVEFNARRALANDGLTIAATAVALAFTELHESLPPALAASSQMILIALVASLAVFTSVAIALRTAGSGLGARGAESLADPVRFGGSGTRGILVSGRVRQVDRLENCISLGQQEAILEATLEAAELRPGERLVDIGCGTGKLAVAAAAMLGDKHGGRSHVLGIDATPGMIDLAIERAHDAGVAAEFQVGIAEALPLPDGGADAITSSYFFHHLPSEVKPEALREMWRVLAPGGRLVITDYARARGLYGLIASFPMRMNFYEYVRPQLGGELERIIAAEGLGEPETIAVFLGYITVMRLTKPR